jgi:hypothetical protein
VDRADGYFRLWTLRISGGDPSYLNKTRADEREGESGGTTSVSTRKQVHPWLRRGHFQLWGGGLGDVATGPVSQLKKRVLDQGGVGLGVGTRGRFWLLCSLFAPR